jgi:peroxiredoxin
MTKGRMSGKFAAVVLGLAWLICASPAWAAIKKGGEAPALTGQDLAGQAHALDELKGKWVYVDFWASWCGPCMRELPSVVGLHKDMARNPNFAVLGVSLDSKGTLGDLQKAVKKNGVGYPVIYSNDGCSDIARQWGVNAIPATFLIDPQGRIVGEDIPVHQVKSLIEQHGTSAPAPKQGSDSQPRITVPARPQDVTGGTSSGAPRQEVVKCTDRLLPLSMSSGVEGGRDLEITMDLPPNNPRLSKYRLYLRSNRKDSKGVERTANWRYDISVFLDPRNTRAPYYIEIKDITDPAKSAGLAAPELTAMIDPYGSVCQFVVPLAPGTTKLNYAMALLLDSVAGYSTAR